MLVVAFLNPPTDVIALQVEKIIVSFIFSAFAWAYIELVTWATWMSRSQFKLTKAEYMAGLQARGITTVFDQSRDLFEGNYLEASSSVTLIILTSVGMGFIFWLRTHISPSIHNPSILNTVLFLLIVLGVMPFYPYPKYDTGLTFFSEQA